jgi:hypothetical protein
MRCRPPAVVVHFPAKSKIRTVPVAGALFDRAPSDLEHLNAGAYTVPARKRARTDRMQHEAWLQELVRSLVFCILRPKSSRPIKVFPKERTSIPGSINYTSCFSRNSSALEYRRPPANPVGPSQN